MRDEAALTVEVVLCGEPLVGPLGATGVGTPAPKGTVPYQSWLVPGAVGAAGGVLLGPLSLVNRVTVVGAQVQVAVE